VISKPFAFVLMPFDKSFDDIYRLGIQAAAEVCGIVAERVDEQIYTETILERIYRQIDNADFIVADMTGRNPNVFYEVGFAHAKDKLCTLLTQNANDIPFDLRHHRHLVYEGSIQKLKEMLIIDFEWMKKERALQKASPFSVHLKTIDGRLVRNDYSAHSHVDMVFEIQNKTKKRTPEIEGIYLQTEKSWKFNIGGTECPSSSADNPNFIRHFITPPVQRVSPGLWTQIKLEGRKRVWSKWNGDELKEKYTHSGNLLLEISTSEGIYRAEINATVDIEEDPF
jgi:nucleoside 2-deoxyribosyltransferase